MKTQVTAAFDPGLSATAERMRWEAAADRAAIERWEGEGGRFLAAEEALAARPKLGDSPDAARETPGARARGRT